MEQYYFKLINEQLYYHYYLYISLPPPPIVVRGRIDPFTFIYGLEYTFVNVYKRRGKNKIKLETYIDGPFYYDKKLSKVDARIDLRNRCYNQMVERSKLNELELVKYVKKENV